MAQDTTGRDQIIYGFHMADLENWLLDADGTGEDAIDMDATKSSYVANLRAFLKERFPDTVIEIRYDLNTTGALPSPLKPRYLDADGNDHDVYTAEDIQNAVSHFDTNMVANWIVTRKEA
jgi:hypothetical protein